MAEGSFPHGWAEGHHEISKGTHAVLAVCLGRGGVSTNAGVGRGGAMKGHSSRGRAGAGHRAQDVLTPGVTP